MLDPELLRKDSEEVARRLASRGFDFDARAFMQLENRRKVLQMDTQALQQERNARSAEIGQAKSKNEDITSMREAIHHVSTELDQKKSELADVLSHLEQISLSLPNLPHDSVPIGRDENDNVEVRRFGEIPSFDFKVKSHDELGEALKQMHFDLGAKITGSRFVVLTSQLAQLQRALIQFMLDIHTLEHGYQDIAVPYIVNSESLIGTGQLPKFEADLFKLTGENEYYLTSTAEIPVTNTVRNMILGGPLPIRYVCHSPCFRSEAGSYGRDTRGMIRQHQFEKVELVWITDSASSYEALEQLTHHAEVVLQRLHLPYRVVALCTGDLGGTSCKTYDLEVWLPSQDTYREISSCSNTEAYQARRMKTRQRNPKTRETEFVHTLNGSGLAVGRTLVAIMENYQDAEGNIHIPKALQPYMRGLEAIKART